jgi:hypothetical protein
VGKRLSGAPKAKMEALIGYWKFKEGASLSPEHETIVLEFTREGILIYSAVAGGKVQRMFLDYVVKDGFMVSNQKSAPREEVTAFKIPKSTPISSIKGNGRHI